MSLVSNQSGLLMQIAAKSTLENEGRKISNKRMSLLDQIAASENGKDSDESKTDALDAQDRKLELQLKGIETRQKEAQEQIDSYKKLIDGCMKEFKLFEKAG